MLTNIFAFAFLLLAEPGVNAGEQAANAFAGNLLTMVWNGLVILFVAGIFAAFAVAKQWAFSLTRWGGYVITFFNDGLASAMVYLLLVTLTKGWTASYIASIVQQTVLVFVLGGAGGVGGWWKWGDDRYESDNEGFGNPIVADNLANNGGFEDAM